MEEIKYDDLLSVPFKKGGRGTDGMDCYGLCIEMCRRCGKTLPDFATDGAVNSGNDGERRGEFSQFVRQTSDAKVHGLVEYLNQDNEIHIGFILDRQTYIHATTGGVRVTPLLALKNPKFYEVIR